MAAILGVARTPRLVHIGKDPLLLKIPYPTTRWPQVHIGIPRYSVLVALAHPFAP